MVVQEFGITVSCYEADLPLLRGCLESIKTNLDPALPICLITHGDVPTDGLCKTYDCFALRESEVDPRLQANSYGYGLTKMVAFWHSPFDRFLHIDADAVCWGDFLKNIPWKDFDLIYNEPHEEITDYILRRQYFDPRQVFGGFPYFPWEGSPFFNTGVFIGHRGIFEIDEYLELLAFQRTHPTALLCGDQGILNFMTFRKMSAGLIRGRSWPFQAVVPVIPEKELHARFRVLKGKPQVNESDRRVIHWAGAKPYLTRDASFPGPMNHYRMEHLRRVRSPMRYLGGVGLMLEELNARVSAAHEGSYLRAMRMKMDYVFSRARDKVRKSLGDSSAC